jgi:hypothetical protein
MWLTPHAAIVGEAEIADAFRYFVEDGDHRFSFHADGKEVVALALSGDLRYCSSIVGSECRSFSTFNRLERS